ncbi:MAG: hypothetical protein PUB67_00650 [Clostridiales bacterium]|nr:hypothetical protein [Clostridiales bacterium]
MDENFLKNMGMPTLIENKTLDDNIILCLSLGLAFIELNMNFPEYQIDRLEDTGYFYKKAARHNLVNRVHSVMAGAMYYNKCPKAYARVLATL